MRRARVHLAFALAAAGFAALGLWESAALREAGRVNAQIAGAAAGQGGTVPEARLARALALSEAGDYDAALRVFKAIAHQARPELRRIALFDLGNLNMREAARRGAGEDALPFVELAKQHYRDLLREDPADWDARYNLERALWLAPEFEEEDFEALAPIPGERAITTMQAGKAPLP